MKILILSGWMMLCTTGFSQVGTTLTKPVPEKDFQEIKGILSNVNNAAFRLELMVVGANGTMRREVLGGMDMAKLRMDPNTKNFMVNNSGAIGGLRIQQQGDMGTMPSDPSKMNQGQQRSNQNAATLTQVGQTSGQGNPRPSGFGGPGQSRPGTQSKTEEGAAADKTDKTPHDNKTSGGSDRTGNNSSGNSHTNRPPVPANSNNYGRTTQEDGKKPEPAKNTGGGGSQNPASNSTPANTWTGNTTNKPGSIPSNSANTWTGTITSGTAGGGNEEDRKKQEMANVSNPAPNQTVSQGQPGMQRTGANQTISFPPNFRQGSFFICDQCKVDLVGQPTMNKLESLLAKYK